MNKLREKFSESFPHYSNEHFIDQCEQITDDFSVALLVWLVRIDPKDVEKEIDYNQSDEIVAKELQKYFKDNIYK